VDNRQLGKWNMFSARALITSSVALVVADRAFSFSVATISQLDEISRDPMSPSATFESELVVGH